MQSINGGVKHWHDNLASPVFSSSPTNSFNLPKVQKCSPSLRFWEMTSSLALSAKYIVLKKRDRLFLISTVT